MAPNVDLLKRTLAYIEANERAWDQTVWRRKDPVCGTAMCFAGWAVTLAGDQWASEAVEATEIRGDDDSFLVKIGDDRVQEVDDRAAELLGLTYEQVDLLFFSLNDLDDIRLIVGEICEGAL